MRSETLVCRLPCRLDTAFTRLEDGQDGQPGQDLILADMQVPLESVLGLMALV